MGHPGDSAEQRAAERVILDAVARALGTALEKRSVTTPGGRRIEIDGAAEDDSVLVEVYAHQGRLKGSQPDKVMTDALKLLWAGSLFEQPPTLVLALASEEAAKGFVWDEAATRGRWYAEALRDLGIEVLVVPLSDEERARLHKAQARQTR